jgi:hypothetical protein
MDFGADNRGKLWRRQNALEGGGREAGVLVGGVEDRPGGAAT